MSYFLAFAGFAALIILHEFGHFAAAKAVGMRVERFMLFFPPILWKVRRGETEYGIGAIPLGGYVKIVGMTRPQPVDLWRIIDAADEARLRRSEEEADELTPAVDALERSGHHVEQVEIARDGGARARRARPCPRARRRGSTSRPGAEGRGIRRRHRPLARRRARDAPAGRAAARSERRRRR